MKMILLLCLLVVAIAGPIAAQEETVVLTNGDRVTGQVESLANGVFQVTTPYGALSIPKSKVARIEFYRDPLDRIVPDQEAVQNLVKTLRRSAADSDADLFRTAMDLIESYRKIGQGKNEEGRVEELRRRLEAILPRFEEKQPEGDGEGDRQWR